MIFKHTVIYLLARIIPGIMAFIGISLYTHLLSPDQYGLYTLLLTSSMLLHHGLFNWLPTGALRFWFNKDYDDAKLISTLLITYIKLALLFSVLTLIVVLIFWGKVETNWIANIYLLILALSLYTLTQKIFMAKIQPLNFAYLTISYASLALFFGALFAYLGYGPNGIIFGIMLGNVIPILFVFKKVWLPFHKKDVSKTLFRKLWVFGVPMSSALLLEEIIKTSDRFMLAGLQDKAQAGLYAVAYDLSGISIFMIMMAINFAAYPLIIKLLETKGKQAAIDYSRHYAILLFAVAIPATVGLNLIGSNLIKLLIDTSYQEPVIQLLPWMTVSLFLMGLQIFYFNLSYQLGHHTIGILKINLIIALMNISLNYLLIPSMGLKGAAIATISSSALGVLLSAFLGRRYFSLPFPIVEITKTVIAALFMCLCLWQLKELSGWGWLVIQIFIGMLSYFIIIYRFDVLDIQHNIRSLLKKPT